MNIQSSDSAFPKHSEVKMQTDLHEKLSINKFQCATEKSHSVLDLTMKTLPKMPALEWWIFFTFCCYYRSIQSSFFCAVLTIKLGFWLSINITKIIHVRMTSCNEFDPNSGHIQSLNYLKYTLRRPQANIPSGFKCANRWDSHLIISIPC